MGLMFVNGKKLESILTQPLHFKLFEAIEFSLQSIMGKPGEGGRGAWDRLRPRSSEADRLRPSYRAGRPGEEGSTRGERAARAIVRKYRRGVR